MHILKLVQVTLLINHTFPIFSHFPLLVCSASLDKVLTPRRSNHIVLFSSHPNTLASAWPLAFLAVPLAGHLRYPWRANLRYFVETLRLPLRFLWLIAQLPAEFPMAQAVFYVAILSADKGGQPKTIHERLDRAFT